MMMECAEKSNINYNCNNGVDHSAAGDHHDMTSGTATLVQPQLHRICAGCKISIEDEFSLHVSPNLDWHVSCLVCCECQEYMDENCETCFIKDGRPYCRSDYIRLFGIQCSKCSESINSNTLVMRAKHQIFHVECFSCVICEKKLSSGEQFGMVGGKLYCKLDFEALPIDTIESTIEAELFNDSSAETLLHTNGCHSTQGGNTSPSTSSQLQPGGTDKLTDKNRRCSVDQKQPRVRTVLTEQQLQTLRSVYQTNPRPDALLKEQLCELTGLSPRVIRVWFQNRRCKDKKAMQKAEAARLQSGGKLPMTPQTPITPDSMNQVSPHGVMQAFTYPMPGAAGTYDNVTAAVTLPPTPSHTCVSPIIYTNTPLWASPNGTADHNVSPYTPNGPAVDFTSPAPISGDYLYSTSASLPQPTTVTHFSF